MPEKDDFWRLWHYKEVITGTDKGRMTNLRLIIGSTGQLGYAMQRALTARGQDYLAYDYPDIDITKRESMVRLIDETKPEIVINCAAYTNVDQAETSADMVYAINALGPKLLAQICHDRDIELVHVSTDYVFSGVPIVESGAPRPYVETDPCDPQTVYGRTKHDGERFVWDNHDKCYMMRTAWLYGEGNNFVRTMLKLAQNNQTLTVVNDQIGSPTSSKDLAEAICTLVDTGAYGLYHATCEGQCSWYDFAKKIFDISGMDVDVLPVTSEQFVRPAKRPKWSVLENERLKMAKMNVFRHWEEALKDYLSLI